MNTKVKKQFVGYTSKHNYLMYDLQKKNNNRSYLVTEHSFQSLHTAVVRRNTGVPSKPFCGPSIIFEKHILQLRHICWLWKFITSKRDHELFKFLSWTTFRHGTFRGCGTFQHAKLQN